MTHEPECPRGWKDITGEPLLAEAPEGFICVYCLISERAYKRGSKDESEQAARRVSAYLDSTPDWVAHEIEAAAFGQ